MRRTVSLAPALVGVASIALFAGCSDPPYSVVKVGEAAESPPDAARSVAPLRFSVAAIESPLDTYERYAPFVDRLTARTGVRIQLVQRRTYREVNDLLLSGNVDAAILCIGGYLDLRRRGAGAVEVIAVPVVAGRTSFESLIVVPAASTATRVEHLAGKRFAFTDELSFSGHIYVEELLKRLGRDPHYFFGETVFTRSHDRAVVSAAKGLVDGAAVHSVVFEHLVRQHPEIARQVRVIHRSPEFGGMPVVVSTRVSAELRARLRAELLSLASDAEGAAALKGLGTLGIDRFVVPPPNAFESAAELVGIAR